MTTGYRVIGQPLARTDGPEKVTGEAIYSADVQLPGTLWGKALRSPFAHARIVRIDASRAKQVEGVFAVLTGDDVRGVRYGRRLRDVPVLAEDEVRFIGERVAAVAAVDEDVAQQALDLIEVQYEELPALLDPLEAMRDDAPLVHPDMLAYEGYLTIPGVTAPPEKPTNVFSVWSWGKGDVEEGFAQADFIVESTYTTPVVHHAYLEPNSCLVWIDGEGKIQVWASNKTPYDLRRQLSEAIDVPQEQVVLNSAFIGGDFGGKGSPMDVPLCYFLAKHSGQPVRMVMDYLEEFMAGDPRHASVTRFKTGVKNDGSLTAHQAEAIFNSGAYGGFKPAVNLPGAMSAGGLYKVPHAKIESKLVYTHTVHGGHMRSPGEPQTSFAMESHIDEIAYKLGMNPLEYRRFHGLRLDLP
jgi:CO/xanthine dehydrogenase Mo-binding subunit